MTMRMAAAAVLVLVLVLAEAVVMMLAEAVVMVLAEAVVMVLAEAVVMVLAEAVVMVLAEAVVMVLAEAVVMVVADPPTEYIKKKDGQPGVRQDCTLLDDTGTSGTSCKLTFWESQPDLQAGSVIVMKQARVGDFGGRSHELRFKFLNHSTSFADAGCPQEGPLWLPPSRSMQRSRTRTWQGVGPSETVVIFLEVVVFW
eukprot:s732_g7.t1